MGGYYEIHPDHLVAVVWPRQSAPRVRAGELTWQDAAAEAWAMDADKADRVRALIAVYDDVVVGAWMVTAAVNESFVPVGKSRAVNRSSFTLVDDDRMSVLVGTPSPRSRRRNPQTTLQVRDLPGGEALLCVEAAPTDGLVQLGKFILIVQPDGRAELRMPAGAVLTVRTGI